MWYICILLDGDFGSVDMNLTFTGAVQELSVSIPIMDVVIFENPETFTINLVLVTSNVKTNINPSQATIIIMDDDRELF